MNEIKIKAPILKERKLSSEVSVSKDLEKYFKQTTLNLEYDTDITEDESILNIPLTATILPLAWLTGINVHVGKLDKGFKDAMDKVKPVLNKMFPNIPFSGNIIAEELVENRINPVKPDKRWGILFSGGVDSIYSLIRNLEQKPSLVMTWGLDDFPYPERSDHWNKTIEIYSNFAAKKNLDIFIIKTNICKILNYRRIQHRYHKELFDGSLRMALQHSLIIIPPLAPLSIGRFDRIIIAASLHPGHDYETWPFAVKPEVDEKIVWADTTVQHDGYIMRHDKIMAIAEQMKKEDLTLRVCTRSKLTDGLLNDSMCEKCLVNIMHLIYAGVDPNKCGFKADEATFELIKNMWGKKNAGIFSSHWWELQELVDKKIDNDMYGSKKFFEWFRDYKFDENVKNWIFTDIYYNLPYNVASKLDIIYKKLGINVHQLPWVREKRIKRDTL